MKPSWMAYQKNPKDVVGGIEIPMPDGRNSIILKITISEGDPLERNGALLGTTMVGYFREDLKKGNIKTRNNEAVSPLIMYLYGKIGAAVNDYCRPSVGPAPVVLST